MRDVTNVKVLEDCRLHLTFDDGAEGDVDMAPMIAKGGVFSALTDSSFFRKVTVNADVGTICWPNGADVCPDVLYALATGKGLPDWAEESSRR